MGNTKHTKALEGQTFGRLTILERDYSKSTDKGIYWKVRCSCGKEKSVRSRALTSGNTQSCGCLAVEINTARIIKPEGEANFHKLYTEYQRGAKKRNYAFELTKEQFRVLTQQPCRYCGIEPKQVRTTHSNQNGYYVHNGIDRRDNTKGYIIGNVVSCCKTCNQAKHVMTEQDFLQWVERVYNYSIRDS